MKLWDRIEIFWIDAFCDSEAAMAQAFVLSYKPCERRTVGYFIGERDRTVFIAETRDDRSNSGHDCERVNAIPRGMITQIVLLDERREPKRRR